MNESEANPFMDVTYAAEGNTAGYMGAKNSMASITLANRANFRLLILFIIVQIIFSIFLPFNK